VKVSFQFVTKASN